MIRNCTGNLVETPADALVNTVNTVGVMGKGIALQFRRAYPEMFKEYERACRRGEVSLGKMHVWETNQLAGPRFIINFPTKGHWKAKSRLVDVEAGLVDLVDVIAERHITSIAVPPLGCGNGGLRWDDVRPRIEAALGTLDVDVCLFPPGATPEAATMPSATKRPALTKARAVALALMGRYSRRGVGMSLLEAQKAMYFLERFGEPLGLEFVKARYGPYSNRLDHVIQDMEGHFVTGFGDGTAKVTDAEPLFLLPGVEADATRYLEQAPATVARMNRVLDFVDGFETPYFMELLATLHWIGTFDEPEVTRSPELAGDLVRGWSHRKAGLFAQDHVEACWNRLVQFNWLTQAAA